MNALFTVKYSLKPKQNMILKILIPIITYAVCRNSEDGREYEDISKLQSDTKNSQTECP